MAGIDECQRASTVSALQSRREKSEKISIPITPSSRRATLIWIAVTSSLPDAD
jgi:hypothetical protein